LYDESRRSQSTGKERDAESGLDYFGARYYGSGLGRFTSPDEPFNDQDEKDPQSWNLYAYVRNNPLLYIDPDGRACSSAKDSEGRTVINDLDGKGCAELHNNTVSAFGDNPGYWW
jgi:RHS repeat-associated protein